ncbi:ubiquinol-cytochrome C chaperone family protein [Azospirillum sp. ST 5-10]|uniref:ubiquinol-cytochrome C chaperone family protein n=1 Tax=unclassified Azospirillum TaxID=2630922 RepID=UPI003F49D490
MFDRLFRRRRDLDAGSDFYAAIVAQARCETFYRDLGVPDTIDGRFDLVALHVFLAMHRLKGQGAAADARARQLYDIMVVDFDRTLRELGVGDSGIGRRVTAMIRAITGRIAAYDRALAAADARALEVALDNNLYGTVHDVDPAALAALAAYIRMQVGVLAGQPVEALLDGAIRFAPPAAPAHSG